MCRLYCTPSDPYYLSQIRPYLRKVIWVGGSICFLTVDVEVNLLFIYLFFNIVLYLPFLIRAESIRNLHLLMLIHFISYCY
jgi:hypothetical protein